MVWGTPCPPFWGSLPSNLSLREGSQHHPQAGADEPQVSLSQRRQLFLLWLGLFLCGDFLGSVGEWADWLGETMKRTKSRQTAVLTLSVLMLTLFAPWVFGQDPDLLTVLRRQAEQGHAGSQYLIGLMYAEGQGVSQDFQVTCPQLLVHFPC